MASLAVITSGCDPMRRDCLTTQLPASTATQVVAVGSNRMAIVEAMRVVAAMHDLTEWNIPTNRVAGVVVGYKDAKHDGHFTVTVRESNQPGQYQIEIFEMPAVRRSKLSTSVEAEIRKALPEMFPESGEAKIK